MPEIPEKSWGWAHGSSESCARPRKPETLELLAPEIGPGGVLIATPESDPPGPGTFILATRFGAHVPKSQKFWKSGGISEIRKFQKNPGGGPMDPGHPVRDPEKSRLSSC